MPEREPEISVKHSLRGQRKDAVASRCRILEVARQLFRECGVGSVSMHQIAKTAHVGQGTLYRNYSHKGELCLELLKESAEAFLQDLSQWIQASQGTLTDVDVLDGIVQRIVDFTDSRLELLATINSANFVGENTFYRQIHDMVTPILRCVLSNDTDTVQPTMAADILLSACAPSFYLFECQTRGYSKEQILQGIRSIYLTGALKR
jgi:AcrR family transcriptional regulator